MRIKEMKLVVNNDISSRAEILWSNGETLEAGRVLFEAVPERLAPYWANNILKAAISCMNISIPLVEELVVIADNPARWDEGHQLFRKLRQEFLRLQNNASSKMNGLDLTLLNLAELVAKITFNASKFDGAMYFDEDTGWWFVKFIDSFEYLEIKQACRNAMWEALIRTDVSGH